MKRGAEKLLSHTLMVAAPLLVLFMITVAWFVNARTIGLSELSFAAQDAGPGAVLYPVETLEGRTYDKDAATLAYSKITWGEKLAPEDSGITIKDMVPGQCEYYLLVSDGAFLPRLLNINITDASGNTVTDADETLLMTQCLGLYLIPTTIDLTASPAGQSEQAPAVISLERGTDQKLNNAIFKGGPNAVTWPEIQAENAQTAYILAVFCDPVYRQNGADSKATHVGALPGAISFSLAFDKVEGT